MISVSVSVSVSVSLLLTFEMWTSVSGHRALGPAAQHHFSGHGHRRFPAVPSENLDESELHISNWKATNSDVGGPLGVV